NHIHDMTNITCSGSPGGAALGDDAGSNNTYDGNVVNNIGGYPTACDYVHAIYVDDDGDIVSNNIAYNNAGNGLYTNHGTGRVIFTNNISFANKEYGVGVNGTGSGNIVQNNILIGNSIAGIKTWSGTSNTQVLHNIFYNNATNTILDGSSTQSGNSTADPGLVNYQSNGSGDYHLRANSIAIDAGVSTYAPAIDFDGRTRPQGKAFDIGAYEYAVAASPSPAPSPTPTPNPTPTPPGSSSGHGTGSTPSPTPAPAPTTSQQSGSTQTTTTAGQQTSTSTQETTQTTTTIASSQGEPYSKEVAQAATAPNTENFATASLPLCEQGQSLGHNQCTCTNSNGSSTAAICSTARVANPLIIVVTGVITLVLALRIVQAVRIFQNLGTNPQMTPILRRRVILSAIGIVGSILIYISLASLIPGGLLNR
ncbi:MAG TPA: right-handed parallel beta-helix repeat-containing protein, partial [Candidatus Saccharimonadales bacterium]|nr:right-handed parallel beta-helix repeat-containing protein [Candidatus Saccharimonadales bacterium]